VQSFYHAVILADPAVRRKWKKGSPSSKEEILFTERRELGNPEEGSLKNRNLLGYTPLATRMPSMMII
jgi:hypothetical protein